MSTTLFRRPPRTPRPAVPENVVALQPPPELVKVDTGNTWLTALPALSGLGSVAYLFAGPPNPITYVAGSFFLFSSLAMVGGSLLRARSTQKGDTQQQRRDYLRYLERTRGQVRRAADAQRAAAMWNSPPPEQLWSVAAGPRLWERRVNDPDFGVVRIALGAKYLATKLEPGESGPVEDLDSLCVLALKRFLVTHSVVPDLPVELSLRRFAAIGISGDRDQARSLVRAVIAHAATFHSPQDLRVVICTDQPDSERWSWAKWLPHAQHPDQVDHAGRVRLIHPLLGTLEEWLGAQLTGRARFNRTAEPDPDVPHLVVVLDGSIVLGSELVLDGLQAVTVLDLDGRASDLVTQHGMQLTVDDGKLDVRVGSQQDHLGTAASLAIPVAEALARQLSGYRLDVATAQSEDLSTVDQTLPGLLNVDDPGALDIETLWKPRPLKDRLRVPIGISADGTVLHLDIKESSDEGMGPHGLIIGATGSGKSELLRTLVLGMAATHPPVQLNMVLVDFKGGVTFAEMERLPHVAAVISNLERDLTMVDRMQEALSGELNRRQEVLRSAGNLVSVRDYEQARLRGVPLAPLPILFVVVDEFSELLSQKPDFADLFAQIGRLGRALGVHLLLASQRLDEGRLRGLESHLSYRIGLRTFSEQESRAVLGVTDAVALPNAPGHGFLKDDASEPKLKRFRAAYVSGAYRGNEAEAAYVLAGTADIRRFPAGLLPVPAQVEVPEPVPDDNDGTDRPSLLTVMVEQLAGKGSPARQVWLPPLDEPDTLDGLFPDLQVREGRGLGADPDSPPLRVRLGTIDRPYHQRRDPLTVALDGAGGHVAIVGRPGSGKSTLLRTLIAALALRHTPAEVQFYALDFSGTLFGMAGLPHVGRVAGRQEAEVVRRVVAEISGVVHDREVRFRELGVDSMADYRRMCAEGDVTDDKFGDVFMVIDGWSTLCREYEDLETAITALMGRSLSYGVHVVVTANRYLDLRLGLRDLVGTKLELKLGDSLDSEVDRKLQAAVPADRPGRGASPAKYHYLAAVPRIDGRRTAADLSVGVADLVRRVSEAWTGPVAPPVRLLPQLLEFTDLPACDQGIALGLEGQRLEPLVFDLRQDRGLVLIGDAESGKTSTLRMVARQVVQNFEPHEAKLIIVDHKHTMVAEFSGESLLGYAATAQQTHEVIAGLVKGITDKRLPGPDVTPQQLRSRSWWTGPEIFVLVDDYDRVATVSNPLLQLVDFLPQAREIGLHLYITRRAGGAGKAMMMDPVLSAMRELGFPGVLLSASREEGALYGVQPRKQPPGRGTLVHHRLGMVPVQLARMDPVTIGN